MRERSLFAVMIGYASCVTLSQPIGAEDAFRFAVISDPQVRSSSHYWTGICRKALEELGQFEPRPLFVVATGDLVDGRSGKNMECPARVYHPQYELLLGLIEKHLHSSIKFYPVVGNHDYHRSNDGSPSGPELYAKYWFSRIPDGVSPRNSPYYSFDCGNTHFVVICTGLLGVRRAPDYDDLVNGKQYEWLAHDLAQTSKRDDIQHILVRHPTVMAADRWHHLALTYGRQALRLHVDGKTVAQQAATGPLREPFDSVRAGSWWNGKNSFEGLIDEVHVVSRAIPSEQLGRSGRQ